MSRTILSKPKRSASIEKKVKQEDVPTEEKINVTKNPPTHPAFLNTKGSPNIPTPF